MLRLKRRTFFKSAALGLAAWGLDGLSPWSRQYGRALAQPARRKIAVLIGINAYPSNQCGCQALQGCITDLELQHQLLAYRFGFRWEDIYTLVDQEATRSGIEEMFFKVLQPQVEPDDLVVIHFSGYGSTIAVNDRSPQPSFVAIDSYFPTDNRTPINDLPQETLRLMVQSLPTHRVVTVLDTSFELPQSALLRRSAQVRTRPQPLSGFLAEEALTTQQRLRESLKENLSAPSPFWPGLLLSASSPDQAALELKGDRYTAGVFTTCLTRQLWQAVPASTIYIDVQRLQNRTAPIVWQTQTPRGESSLGNTINLQSLGLVPTLAQGLEGVITNMSSEGQELELWLGGLSNSILQTYGSNAAFRIARSSSQEPEIVLQLIQRDRFMARAKVISGGKTNSDRLFIGQGIQEKIRLLPQVTSLVMDLDANLDRVERVDATSACAAIDELKLTTQISDVADYVFGRLGQVVPNGDQPWNPYKVSYSSGRYGLAAPGQDVLPGTASVGDEAVKTAIQRLEPRFKSLLAIKMLSLLENAVTTHVPLTLRIENCSTGESLVDYRAERALSHIENSAPSNSIPLVNLGVGQSLRYCIGNLSDRSLYGVLLAYEPNGSFSVAYPESLVPGSYKPLQNWAIEPQSQSILDGILPGITPEISLVLVVSRQPFKRTLSSIGSNLGTGISVLKSCSNPLVILQNLLQDLQTASQETWSESGRSDAIALDMSAWAALRLTGHLEY